MIYIMCKCQSRKIVIAGIYQTESEKVMLALVQKLTDQAGCIFRIVSHNTESIIQKMAISHKTNWCNPQSLKNAHAVLLLLLLLHR